MATAIFRTTNHAEHDEPSHVEQAARLSAIEQAIGASGLLRQAIVNEGRPVSEKLVRAVHSPRMIERLQYASYEGESWLDSDTYVMFGSWEAAMTSAGTAVDAVTAVCEGRAENAFALVRPPGHHATPSQSMGFCLINNIAIAARFAVDTLGLERVAIVDIDVHHGNGTQDCFYSDPQVLFCSSHGVPLYPGTGDVREIGAGPGKGFTLNAPLPYNVGDTGFQQLYAEVIIPALRRYKPQMILVSAGFDAHWDDLIGPLSLSVSGYAGIIRQLKQAAADLCDGKIVLVLEGGYSLRALAACSTAALAVLMDKPVSDPLGPAPSEEPDIAALIGGIKATHPLLA